MLLFGKWQLGSLGDWLLSRLLFVRSSLWRWQNLPKIHTLFCLVHIKKRSFLTSCVLWWFVSLNASSHLCFRFFVTWLQFFFHTSFRVSYMFVRSSLCRRQNVSIFRTLFCLVHIKKRPFLTSGVFWFVQITVYLCVCLLARRGSKQLTLTLTSWC